MFSFGLCARRFWLASIARLVLFLALAPRCAFAQNAPPLRVILLPSLIPQAIAQMLPITFDSPDTSAIEPQQTTVVAMVYCGANADGGANAVGVAVPGQARALPEPGISRSACTAPLGETAARLMNAGGNFDWLEAIKLHVSWTPWRLALSIGLLCSKTFDDAIFDELFEAKYGLARADIVKMNIKGVFQIWMRDGAYHEIPLKECHGWTREGCKSCPDFAAEHADISTGGIGAFSDWTLTIIRTDKGRDVLEGMVADGVVETRPGDDDPGAIELLHKLARVSRRRWPETAVEGPRRIPVRS